MNITLTLWWCQHSCHLHCIVNTTIFSSSVRNLLGIEMKMYSLKINWCKLTCIRKITSQEHMKREKNIIKLFKNGRIKSYINRSNISLSCFQYVLMLLKWILQNLKNILKPLQKYNTIRRKFCIMLYLFSPQERVNR